ncbi:N-acetylglucosamine-6-phosphate deacetylase [Alkalibacillus aidingensis]|uniref:N-acetylglucosamine-6-phosphate deacetylase n=1 Tax=Alkalibacillus aidingensis TaxID=2747607 RepID=UPI0016618891|nr:N-acetylglucosamine-6-phosphate deacetylase [Alkalibacillus aidingensis]
MYTINHVNIYLEEHVIHDGSVTVKDGKIKQILERPVEDGEVINGRGLHLVPGLIDTHIHGAVGYDVMDESTDALTEMAKALPKEGTTSFLATTVTSPLPDLDLAIERIANYQGVEGTAEILGAHVEGPFIAKNKAGAQPVDSIVTPDVEVMKRWLSYGVVKAVTFAPELENGHELLRLLNEHGVVTSAGHTDAKFDDIKEAVDIGLQQLTHLCNAMNGIHHREVGAVGAAMLIEKLKSELIADGIHVSEPMLKLIYDTIGPERIMLITDAMRAKDLYDGTYTLGGQTVTVEGDQATLANGTLAGSVLKMDQGVRRMMTLCGASFHDVIRMASENPAKQYGVWDRKGSIAVGKDADFLLVDDDFQIQATYCKGVIGYETDTN